METVNGLLALLMVMFALAAPLSSFAEVVEESALLGKVKSLKEVKPIEITYEKQTHLNIANKSVNRINFNRLRVMKIIGNISGFNTVLSDDGSDLFIVPNLPVGSKIDFSALLSSGDVIDFCLTVISSKTPYLVKLRMPSNLSINNNSANDKSESVKMIETMSSGETGKYYVQHSLQKMGNKINVPINAPTQSGIKVIAQDSYRFGNLFGVSLILHNTNSISCEITTDDLVSGLSNVLAACIVSPHLPSQAKTKAFLVFKKANE